MLTVPQASCFDNFKISMIKYFKFEGRARRSEFWFFKLFVFIINLCYFFIISIIFAIKNKDMSEEEKDKFNITDSTPVWIIYTIMLCLWSNNDKIKDLLKLIHNCKKYKVNRDKNIKKKYDNIAWKIKFKVIVYSIIEFLLLGFCFVYFVTFCTVYTGTMSKVFKAYGIALIEVLIIKIIYGIVLAILRKISLDKENKTLYNIILFMNTYLV